MKTDRRLILIFTGFLILNLSCKSNRAIPFQKNPDIPLEHSQIVTDSLYQSSQRIHILKFPNNPDDPYDMDLGYAPSELKTTSQFAREANALAAINGNFFNMDEGGSVSYLEVNDTIVNTSLSPEKKWGLSDNVINGAIVIFKDGNLAIEPKKPEQFYFDSKKEKAVMFSGPLLIQNGEKSTLITSKYVINRHPRTCLCKSEKTIFFITLDGRSTNAHGMNLYELQDFLLTLGCTDAINLDGGGSTTMWIYNKGIVNQPSDKTGERPVANVLLIKKIIIP